MAIRLAYYHPSVLNTEAHNEYPELRALSHFRNLFGDTGTRSHVLIDRSGVIKTPVRTKILHPIPALRPMGKTFEEICNERAIELVRHAEDLNMPLYVFWSGGIDSTLVLVSLLKNTTRDKLDNVVVLMTEESIAENPNFYRDHIRGKLQIGSSALVPYIVGSRAVITNGDLNDPVFGMGTAGRMMKFFGADIIHKPYEREKLFTFFNRGVQNEQMTNLYLELFERLVRAAPVEIKSYFDYVWWLNFSLKWQFSSMKMITATSKLAAPLVTVDYMRSQFLPFYGTEDFQLWSMLNPDKKMKDTWRSFKWICKDIIYDYTGDEEYRDNKMKTGSMRHLFSGERAFRYIDEHMHFYRTLDPSEYYDPENDFAQLLRV